MRFDKQATSGDEPSDGSPADEASAPTDPAERRRRRTTRAWSSPTPPAPPDRERFDKPLTDTAWGWQRAGEAAPEAERAAPAAPAATRRRDLVAPASRRTPVLPPLDPPAPPAAAPIATTGPVPDLLRELRAELAGLREALAAAKPDDASSSLVSGTELAATIEVLGTTLGTGMASLLSDHRSLLARDVEAAADRILEELGQRLRASGTQTVDAVEERVRHVSGKGMTDLSEQLELRLDQIQAEVTGLRAVMLEIPDQTVVTSRLDHLAEAVAAARSRESTRVSPAVTAAIEKTLSGPIEQLEAAIAGIGDAVRELLDERLPELDLPDAAALEALTNEMTALRRRITLRTEDRGGDQGELSDSNLDQIATRVASRLKAGASSARIAADEAVEWDDPDPIPVAKPAARKAPAKATKASPAKRAARRRG
jgi:hypothetical protein